MPAGRPPDTKRPPVAPGSVFGRLTVERAIPRPEGGAPVWWECRCSCGGRITLSTNVLRGGRRRCADCWGKGVPDVTGRRFGRLVVLRADPSGPGKPTRCVCRCDCGTAETRPILVRSLLDARGTRSCGCINREQRAQAARTSAGDPLVAARRAEAVRLRAEGKTLREIGDAFGVTKERARQILLAAGHGGRAGRGRAPAGGPADSRP